MKSIAARLAIWYALAATISLAGLSVVGFYALRSHLIHGLELLNASEYQRIEAQLGPHWGRLDRQQAKQWLHALTDNVAVLFYVQVSDERQTWFVSVSLQDHVLLVSTEQTFNAQVAGLGELRVNRFTDEGRIMLVASSLQPMREVMHGYVQIVIALVTLMLLISIAIGFCLAHLALRPIFVIEETADRIRSDNLSERISLASTDQELANLVRLLNQMFDRLEASFMQARRFAAEASHELKTPLSLIRLQTERMMLEGGLSAKQEEAVHVQLEEVTRLNQLIEELLLISRAEAGAVSLVRVAYAPQQFLQSFAQDARVLAEHRGLQLQLHHTGEGIIHFDAKWIRQVLLNLLVNALNVSASGQLIVVHSELTNYRWRVCVSDQGTGVPPDKLERIFERFVRLAPAQPNKGSGLGLAICKSIIDLHNGRIWAEPSAQGRGLNVLFELHDWSAESGAASASTDARPAGRWRRWWPSLSRHQQWRGD